MKTSAPHTLLLLIRALNCSGASLFASAEDEASPGFDSPLGIKDNYAKMSNSYTDTKQKEGGREHRPLQEVQSAS